MYQQKKKNKLEAAASLNSLPPKSSPGVPVFAHFKVPFDKISLVGVQGDYN